MVSGRSRKAVEGDSARRAASGSLAVVGGDDLRIVAQHPVAGGTDGDGATKQKHILEARRDRGEADPERAEPGHDRAGERRHPSGAGPRPMDLIADGRE
jgi:hypothetical protein